ncbi:permease [Paenibacillus thailandensis]|uniref:Permease n=1 Tax=Paenibacillus thailandensis TaxID=393250 RepID=A0ABW5QX58_9BACL
MSPTALTTVSNKRNSRTAIALVVLFFLVAAGGLLYVKWAPYYDKALTAADTHSIGSSILSGQEGAGTLSSWDAAVQYAVTYFKSVWKAAVLGMLLGSLIQVLIPADWLYRLLGRQGLKSTVIGGVAALPGMMCSCCAAPVAEGMRKRNASVGASLAFWLGNPLLNPATLVFMAFVLPWQFTAIRLVLGVLLTFGVSYIADRLTKSDSVPEMPLPSNQKDAGAKGPLVLRWLKSLGVMALQVVPVYILSVLILSALESYMFPVWLESGVVAVILFALVGTLFVIPTAAEIPIIQTFMSMGLGGGAAAALLVTLPAVSLPSVLLVSRSFPKKALVIVVLSVFGFGLLSGAIGAVWL